MLVVATMSGLDDVNDKVNDKVNDVSNKTNDIIIVNNERIELSPILTIKDDSKNVISETLLSSLNVKHTNWLNDNFEKLKTNQRTSMIQTHDRGLFVITDVDQKKNNYVYVWMTLRTFVSKAEKSMTPQQVKCISEVIEKGPPTAITLLFCDKCKAAILYHV